MSIQKRFFGSFVANVTRSGFSFLTGMLLARFLGPEEYGRYSFLLASFLALRSLTDLGTSSAFFTFISRRKRSKKFILYFWSWIGLQFVLPLLVIGILFPSEWIYSIWKEESKQLVILGFLASFSLNVLWQNSVQMAEAARETLRVQSLNTIVIIFHLLLCLFLYKVEFLKINLLFIAVAIEFSIISWMAFRLYQTEDGINEDTPGSVAKEFWVYCSPFIISAIVGFLREFFDRWMLQTWGGAVEQAYYSISYQFSSIVLIATSSILRIFWKEIAEAHQNINFDRILHLYTKALKGLFFIGASLAGFLIPWTEYIIQITLGERYLAGSYAMMLMFAYPIHQSMGQITGTVLLATGNTSLQVKVGVIVSLASLVLTYLLLAPINNAIPGFALGSQGLAYKMLGVQFFSVNLLGYLIARLFKWKFEFLYQVQSIAFCLVVGFIIQYLIAGIPDFGRLFPYFSVEILKLAIALPLYGLTIISGLFIYPGFAGLSRLELESLYRNIFNR